MAKNKCSCFTYEFPKMRAISNVFSKISLDESLKVTNSTGLITARLFNKTFISFFRSSISIL